MKSRKQHKPELCKGLYDLAVFFDHKASSADYAGSMVTPQDLQGLTPEQIYFRGQARAYSSAQFIIEQNAYSF